jgi:tRNA pseudouridine55 synthase
LLGILLIDKPLGCSSHDVVNTIRRQLGTKRVGHAGTLDPLATGLLVVAVGPATRFLQYLPLEPKEYEGTMLFGKRTSTYDAEGEVLSENLVPEDLENVLAAIKPKFMGLIEQIPPMHSAVKVAGKPLYKYARQGEEVDRQKRTIHISSLEFGPTDGASVDFRLVCSGGTYVRTLADDIGQALGCGAYLTRLRRTRVGRFGLSGAVGLDEVSTTKLLPLRRALEPMHVVGLNERQTESIREGRQVTISEESATVDAMARGSRTKAINPGSEPSAERSSPIASEPDLDARRAAFGASLVALADPHGEVFSVARLLGNLVQPECVIPSEALDGSV